MWGIRILSGPQAGQIFPLSSGKHRIGRGPSCEIKINSNSVSKEHAAILVTGDKVIITDLNSRNGTYVNGVRIQNQRVEVGDKIALYDVLLDIVKVPSAFKGNQVIMPTASGAYPAPPPAWAGNAALQQFPQYQAPGAQFPPQQMAAPHAMGAPHAMHVPPQPEAPMPEQPMPANSVAALIHNFKLYIDNVAMPGVYSVVKTMQFRHALLALVAIYVLIVTALSTIPVVNTTKNNIKQESMRRAKTIARHMAAVNRKAVIEDNETRMSVRQAELEEGVTTAIIIRAKDGTIMAPANKRGEFVNKPFVQRARREEKEMAEFIDDSNLGVSVPITVYSPESGSQSVVAYAIILYDIGALAISAGDTFALFVQTLAIALLIGALLYFFLFKIVEHPIEVLNTNLDDALREGRDDLTTDYQFPVLERLISNINSALNRIDRSGGAQQVSFVMSRDIEAANVVRMLQAAALTINAIDDRVIATNTAFDQLVGGGVNLVGRPLTDIPDVALQENLRDLLVRMRESAGEIATSQIPFSGRTYEINGQAVMGSSDPAYFLIVINPSESYE